ncbi:DNA mismatch repair protein MutL [Augochlora pura]
MDTSIIATSNVTNFPECVLELVLNSLNAKASAIAIRFHAQKRKIQVVDNGVGISRNKLTAVAEYNDHRTGWSVEDNCNTRKQTLTNIRRLSDVMMISSRHRDSSQTYMKVFKMCQSPNIVNIQRRPSCGTTVSIYGFHELTFHKWNIPLMYFLIGNIAIVNFHVSFSIRDDQESKVIMAVSRSHESIEIFKLLYFREISCDNMWHISNTHESRIKFSAFIGLTNTQTNALQYIFLNNRPVNCPYILQIISAAFDSRLRSLVGSRIHQTSKMKSNFILLFISCTDYVFTMKNRKRTLILPSIHNLLLSIQNGIFNIFFNNTIPLSKSLSKTIRRRRNLIYNCINSENGIVFFEKPLTSQKLFSEKNRVLHTVCCVVQEEIKKLTIPSPYGTIIRRRSSNPSYYSDRMNTDKDNRNSIPSYEMNASQILRSKVSDIQKFTPASVVLTLSEWSDWTYIDNKSNKLNETKRFGDSLQCSKHFNFLPKKLHKLLRGNKKLTKTDVLKEWSESELSTRLKSGLHNRNINICLVQDVLLHQEVDIRPCKDTQRFREFKLRKDILKFVTILGQMNNELIVALAIQNNTKMLLMIDQHAIHERIRYETLLNSKYFFFIFKRCTAYLLTITHLRLQECSLLLKNKKQLKRYGINFNIANDNTIVVRTVPECLKKNKYHCDEIKLKMSVQNLLDEMLQKFLNNSIFFNNKHRYKNNLIRPNASPYLRSSNVQSILGAIKFGDRLTLQQCNWLLTLLQETKIPTRCAHGRPSIVPILELPKSETRSGNITQVDNLRKYVYIEKPRSSSHYKIAGIY